MIYPYRMNQATVRVPFGSAVELDELNALLEDKLRLHLAAKRLYRKVSAAGGLPHGTLRDECNQGPDGVRADQEDVSRGVHQVQSPLPRKSIGPCYLALPQPHPVADFFCGDCSSVQEDDPRGLCATHAGKCQNCAASEDLHDGEPSRTKVDAAGNPVVERWCESCSPITERHPAEADPFSLASEEEANPRLTAEQYVERLRLRDGSGHARSYGDAADEQEDRVGQLPHTVTTDFGQGRR